MRFIFSLLFLFVTVHFGFGQTHISNKNLQTAGERYQKGNIDSAIAYLDSLRGTPLVKDSMYINLLQISADLNQRSFHFEGVVRDIEELLSMSSKPEIALQNQLGRYKKYIGDYKGAIDVYKRLIELDPNTAITYNNLASTYNAAGLYKETIVLLQADPKRKKLSLESYHLALAYFHVGRLDSAKIFIDNFLKTKEATYDFLAFKCAAQIYFELGLKKKACTYIFEANGILKQAKVEEEIKKQPKRIQQYPLFSSTLKDIKECKKLKQIICGQA